MLIVRIDMDWISWVAGCIDAYLLPLLWGDVPIHFIIISINIMIIVIIIIRTIIIVTMTTVSWEKYWGALSGQFWVIWDGNLVSERLSLRPRRLSEQFQLPPNCPWHQLLICEKGWTIHTHHSHQHHHCNAVLIFTINQLLYETKAL